MKKIIVVDIDGTIADIKQRLHYIEDKENADWDKFYLSCKDDEPINDIIELVNLFHKSGKTIVFCTGRDEICRKETIEWLNKNLEFNDYKLLMRPRNNKIEDDVLKPRLLLENNIYFNLILCILEDRNSVVDNWRKLGLRVLHVQDNDF